MARCPTGHATPTRTDPSLDARWPVGCARRFVRGRFKDAELTMENVMSNEPSVDRRRWPLTFDVPSWIRHFVSWRILEWINARYHVCWAGMAMWKLGYGWSWELTIGCFEPFDYCGQYDDCPRDRAEALRQQYTHI